MTRHFSMIPFVTPLLLGLAMAASANAQQTPSQPAMTGAEFDAYSKGKTFYYGSLGHPYGAEEYLDGRRVLWSFLDGDCQEGKWYEDSGNICFVYDEHPEPQCWSFFRTPSGIEAEFRGTGQTTAPLYEIEQTTRPMECKGPKVGV